MSRRFAASLWIWSDGFGSERPQNQKIFQKISKFGFDGVEIPSFDGNLKVEEILSILNSRRITNQALIPIIVGGGSNSTNLASVSAPTRRRGSSYVQRLIDICQMLGGDLVAGPLYATVGERRFLNNFERLRVLKLVAKEFKTIANYARDRSVRIALEPLCRYDTYLINTVAQGKELVEMIDSENVGLLLDTFHMNIEEKSIGEAIRLAGDHLYHFHACENDRGTPGNGHVDWNEVREALDQLNYQDWISLESFSPDRDPFSSAMNMWRRLEPTQDSIASDGLNYLKKTLG